MKVSAETGTVALCVAANACAASAMATVIPVFLTTHLRASYFGAGLLLVAGTLASSIVTYGFGRIGDVARLRYPIAIGSAVCGLIGALILTFATTYWAFLLVFASLLAVAGSLFSQLMALAIIHAKSSIAVIRAVASAGWVAGPAIGGIVAAWQSPTALFLSIAATYALLAVVIAAMALHFPLSRASVDESRPPSDVEHRQPASIFVIVSTLAAMHFLLSICALGIPWRIVQIGGSEYHVGLAFAIAAAIEIPIIACSNLIASRVGHATMLILSSIMLLIYFVAASFLDSLPGMVSLSVLIGIVTGIMMGLSLIVLQERIPGRPAHASAIYSNTIRLSYVVALLAAGVIAQQFSVIAIFRVAGVLALCLSLGLILWQPLGPMGLRFRESARNAL